MPPFETNDSSNLLTTTTTNFETQQDQTEVPPFEPADLGVTRTILELKQRDTAQTSEREYDETGADETLCDSYSAVNPWETDKEQATSWNSNNNSDTSSSSFHTMMNILLQQQEIMKELLFKKDNHKQATSSETMTIVDRKEKDADDNTKKHTALVNTTTVTKVVPCMENHSLQEPNDNMNSISVSQEVDDDTEHTTTDHRAVQFSNRNTNNLQFYQQILQHDIESNECHDQNTVQNETFNHVNDYNTNHNSAPNRMNVITTQNQTPNDNHNHTHGCQQPTIESDKDKHIAGELAITTTENIDNPNDLTLDSQKPDNEETTNLETRYTDDPTEPLRPIPKPILPSTELHNIVDTKRFVATVKSSSRYSVMMLKSIYLMGFLFEVGDSKFAKLDSKKQLTNLGKLSQERLKHISELHFMFFDKWQVYLAKTAVDPHYTILFRDLLQSLEKLEHDIKIVFYLPEKDHHTNHLIVRNGESAKSLMNNFKFEGMEELLPNDKIDPSTPRQKKHGDYGISTNQNCVRTKCYKEVEHSGIAEPGPKANTNQSIIICALVLLSKIALTFHPIWMKKRHPFETNTERMKYARSFHEDCIIESVHGAIIDVCNGCACHNDRTSNSRVTPEVICMAYIDEDDRRHSFNGQGRLSMDQLDVRKEDQSKILKLIGDYMEGLPKERLQGNHGLLSANRKAWLPELYGRETLCNMDPHVYSWCPVFCIAMLAKHFNLNYFEIQAAHVASGYLNFTYHFFGLASRALLSRNPQELKECHRGYGFGYLLVNLTFKLFKMYDKKPDPELKTSYARMANQTDKNVLVCPTRKDFNETCNNNIILSLLAMQFESVKDKTKRRKLSKMLGLEVKACTPQVGPVSVKHFLYQKAMLGLAPWWMRDVPFFECHTKASKWYALKFKPERGLQGDVLWSFFVSMGSYLQSIFHKIFTVTDAENILCKSYRHYNEESSDIQWRDTFLDIQYGFDFEGEAVNVIKTDGTWLKLAGNYVFNTVPFGNDYVCISKVYEKFESLRVTSIPEKYNRTWNPFKIVNAKNNKNNTSTRNYFLEEGYYVEALWKTTSKFQLGFNLPEGLKFENKALFYVKPFVKEALEEPQTRL